MREGAFSELDSQPWHHLLAAEADRRPVRVAALLGVRLMSLRYAGYLSVCIPYMIVHSLKSIRQRIGSQCSTIRLGVTWSRTSNQSLNQSIYCNKA